MRQSLRFSKDITDFHWSLRIPNRKPRKRRHLIAPPGFNFPFSSLFFAFPWSREDAIDATPMHKPPSGLSCFHKSASKQGTDTSDAQHSPTQRIAVRSLFHSFARSLDALQFCNPRKYATYMRRIHVNVVVTATDCRAQLCKSCLSTRTLRPGLNVTSRPTSNLLFRKSAFITIVISTNNHNIISLQCYYNIFNFNDFVIFFIMCKKMSRSELKIKV